MKKLICSLVITLSALSIQAATWTFHVPSNLSCYFQVSWVAGTDPINGDGEWESVCYDIPMLVDQDGNPYEGALGWYCLHIYQGWISDGWHSMSTSTFTPDSNFVFKDAWFSSGYPEYMGGNYAVCSNAGEYWIDFGEGGETRTSTVQPTDFGKWAWDGSINPSWVEPLVVKGKKGHRK